MQFITSLFGGSGNSYLTALFALGAVIALIILGVWLLKLVFKVSANGVRGRNRRLAIVDTLQVDQKRQLVIIRRDNVEHLVLTGGAQDLVVETGIAVQEAAPAQPTRRPIPAVAQRRQPAAAAPETRQEPPNSSKSTSPAGAIERLRELSRPANQKPPRSLRHTGLLRPVPPNEGVQAGYKPDISSGEPADSAKQDNDLQASESPARDQTLPTDITRN